ncbi:MAG: potassium channel family protein [Sphingobacteriia bacterium]|jgi:hypothetical protein
MIRFRTTHQRLLFFLFTLLAIVVVDGFFTGLVYDTIFSFAYCLILVQGPYIIYRRRWHWLVFSMLIFSSWGFQLLAKLLASSSLGILSSINWTIFNGYVAWLMLRYTLRTERVGRDHLLVVVITYILIGLTYACAYTTLEYLDPQSFNIDFATAISEVEIWQQLLYFSYMTLGSVGYGDILPQTHFSRMLAISEAIAGIMFMAIFVARMVSLYAAERDR